MLEKFKFLVWFILQNALPTHELRAHWHIISSSSCALCNHPIEDAIHCLKDYPNANYIWNSLGFSHMLEFQGLGVEDWMRKFARSDCATAFLSTFWWIWHLCNNQVLGLKDWMIRETLWHIHNIIDDIIEVHGLWTPSIATAQIICWEKLL